MPGEWVTFARDDILPSYWANNLQKFLSTAVVNFRLQQVAGSDTTIEVPASDPDNIPAIAIHGPLRFNAATVSRAHPGGAAGIYPVFVTAKNNDIRGVPAPFSDFTDYAFDLAIAAPGATPPIVGGTVDIFRKVGEVDWDGAKITAVRQLEAPIRAQDPLQPTATTPGEQPLVVTGAAGQTADLLRVQTAATAPLLRVSPAGVLRAASDVRANDGAATQAALGTQAGAAALLFGSASDAALYRASIGVLKTDGGLSVGSSATPAAGGILATDDVIARQGAATQIRAGSVGGAAGVEFNSDTSITRTGIGVLRASGIMDVATGYRVAGLALGAAHLSDGTTGSGAIVRASAPTISNPVVSGTLTAPALVTTATTVGFYGVTPVVRAAARTMTNWNQLRTIDRNVGTLGQAWDFICTLADDLKKLGLVA